MTVENSPLEPWMVEHIRKMKQGLGMLPAAPDAEEDTMDEELGALSAVADADIVDADVAAAEADDATGGLSVYNNPNVQTAVTARNKLNNEYKKYYDDLTAKIMAQRTGPSFSERMFQLSAALAQPTSRRGFGGVLANVSPVLQAQEQAEREGMDKRRDALSALAAAQLNQRVGLANQDVTTALAMAKLEAMANKPPTIKSVIVENGIAYDPVSGAKVVQPDAKAWAALSAYPTQANLDNFIRTFGPRFAEQAMRTVGSVTGGQR
jgi:hypothetical protein